MNTFTRLSLLLVCLLIFSCDQFNTNKENATTNQVIDNSLNKTTLLDTEFLINGTSFSDALTTVYLHKYENNIPKIIDSAKVKNKTFSLKGKTKAPEVYCLSSNLSTKKFNLLIDPSVIDVFLAESIENSSTYSSTSIQKEHNVYNQKLRDFRTKGVSLYYDLKGDFSSKNIQTLKEQRSKLFTEQGNYTLDFIKNNPNSYYSAIVLNNQINNYSNSQLRTLYNGLSDNIKTETFVKLLDSAIKTKEAIAETKLPIEADNIEKITVKKEEYRPKAYSLSGKNQYGETMSLNSIPKGKVILLDFWASWCEPCRATNPNLVALYKKYNASGFEIMSVSEDKGQPEWMSAIIADNLTWDYHILDKNKSIAFRYGVESIPFKILIDKKGRIASGKIYGQKLEQRIKELLAE
ncbi:thioredoxin-like domain-containing protein [Olleya sp. R77988]|uniref:thioredoxin-like domain-containing protein n=1 Tax=Olleya sp. R77988 TaxID=3093875 RepID=UPI0037C54C64